MHVHYLQDEGVRRLGKARHQVLGGQPWIAGPARSSSARRDAAQVVECRQRRCARPAGKPPNNIEFSRFPVRVYERNGGGGLFDAAFLLTR